MKQTGKRVVALLLVVSTVAVAIGASTLGSWLRKDALELSDTAQLSHGVASSTVSGGRQTENVVEYFPEAGLRPIVAYGGTLYGRSNLNYVASYLSGIGKTPVAGINGSFFDIATGVPIGAIVTDGVLRSSGDVQSVGFKSDGTTVMGRPGLDLMITYANGNTAVSHYNKTLSRVGGTVLYSRDFDAATKNTISAYNVVLQPENAMIQVGKTMTAKVVAVLADTKSCDIPVGSMVLSMANETTYIESMNSRIKTLKVGDTITIESRANEAWQDVAYACGGDDLLVEQSAAKTSFKLDSAQKRAARTAIGLKSDGTLVMYTIDGAQSGYSMGMTLPELASRMVELGCKTALNLDGGGSTTLSAQYPGDGALTSVNKPSDGSQRKCANFIFLARDTAPVGDAVNLHLYPHNAAVLAGANLQMTVKATDMNYLATSAPTDIVYTATGGAVSETGVFTAAAGAGTATVDAQSLSGAGGTRRIRVVDNPTAITIKNQADSKIVTNLTVGSGKSVDLTAAASQYDYAVTSQDTCFTWAVSGEIGTIDQNGIFTAGEIAAAKTGTITAKAGTTAASIQVTVGAQTPEGGVIFGFEPGETVTAGAGLATSQNKALGFVRYGAGSLKAQYDLSQSTAAAGKRQVSAALLVELPADVNTAGLWVWGDNSNNSLSLLLQNGEQTVSKWIAQLNFTGWKYVTTDIPVGATAVTGIAVTEGEGSGTLTGTIYIDQLIAAKGKLADTTAPAISAKLTGQSLAITAADGGSGVAEVIVTLDGETQPFTAPSGTLSLPNGAAHKVQITAKDKCGNLSSHPVEVAGTLAEPFADMAKHWSKSYVNYCYREGIMAGATDANDNLVYRPDASMTRQEFAVALIRFLGLDTAAYTAVTLPFADSAAIAPWAADAMKAAYSLGLVTGAQKGGQLYANPASTINRQEAMAILGRTQPKGYAEDSLAGFSDSAKAAAWAKPDIAAMVARGIIAGSGGKLNPTGPVTRAQVAKMLYQLY